MEGGPLREKRDFFQGERDHDFYRGGPPQNAIYRGERGMRSRYVSRLPPPPPPNLCWPLSFDSSLRLHRESWIHENYTKLIKTFPLCLNFLENKHFPSSWKAMWVYPLSTWVSALVNPHRVIPISQRSLIHLFVWSHIWSGGNVGWNELSEMLTSIFPSHWKGMCVGACKPKMWSTGEAPWSIKYKPPKGESHFGGASGIIW